jgi:alginate O-acetyltransferase complex protein AlgI
MTFVAWGLFHGFFLVLERVAKGSWLIRGPVVFRRAYTLLAVMFGWILFRCATFGQAMEFFAALLGHGSDKAESFSFLQFAPLEVWVAATIGVVCSFPIVPVIERLLVTARRSSFVSNLGILIYRLTWAGALILVSAVLAVSSYKPFIYFQF